MMAYLKTRWKTGALGIFMVAATWLILFLYDVPLEPMVYVAVLCILATALVLWTDYRKYRKRQENLRYIKSCEGFGSEYLDAPEDGIAEIYQEICMEEKRQDPRESGFTFAERS